MQTELFPKRPRKHLLVDTRPRDERRTSTLNLGLEIVADIFQADVVHFSDKVDVSGYEMIGFNVYYPMNIFNVVPFLRLNNIEPRREVRLGSPWLIAGGQGVNRLGILDGIVDGVCEGELDFFDNRSEIISRPRLFGSHAVVELSRGCRRSCSFCEYSARSKPYREKPLKLVSDQLEFIRRRGARSVNLLSADFAGYSKLDELVEETIKANLRITNADACLSSISRLFKWKKRGFLPAGVKIGIESFDEDTRARIKKPFSDVRLEETLEKILKLYSYVHLYLIFGLPGDDFSKWIEWLRKIAGLRRRGAVGIVPGLFGEIPVIFKPLRTDFRITNFEPCLGTELADAPFVNFDEKDAFLREWSAAQIEEGLFLGEKMNYSNAAGTIGRKELSYLVLMTLKRGGSEFTPALLEAFPRGAPRSITDDQAGRFLDIVKSHRKGV